MSSSITHDAPAVHLKNVSKIYRLHGSQGDQLIDVLGLQKFGLKPKTPAKEFAALSDISLEVPKGHRIGIVGRNGAGKTTLLKLICGNFSPSQGEIEVNGQVQALMNIGLGFHPEYTGRENVTASLQYNGLSKSEYDEAIHGIIEFCELGDFLDQPFKTYSLGMQARLMFAAATAIKPDILIVDEVLGAGDAYFVAKSKGRVEKMIEAGCTMLLVSHSMQQVLELCDEAIWMEGGKIKMQGESLLVVKAYEESMHGRMKALVPAPNDAHVDGANESILHATEIESIKSSSSFRDHTKRYPIPEGLLFQSPPFIPHQTDPSFPAYSNSDINGFRHVARGGISRWDSQPGVKVVGFAIQTEHGFNDHIRTLRPAKLIFQLEAELTQDFSCMYGVIFNDLTGGISARIWSPTDNFFLSSRDRKIVEILLNPLQIGPGEYTIGLTVMKSTPLELINTAIRYDQLGRSFSCTIDMDQSLSTATANFMHSAEWKF